jgi:FkbM family methyltransferase
MKDTVSPPGIEPVYHVASPFLERSQGEIKNDAANFYLINDYVNSLSGKGISFDIGGNRGYYTHFMATLGLEVHAFEIEMNMFDCLRHGTLFNPLDVVERTNLYQIGLSDTVGRFGQQGSGGMGFLVSGANGVTPPIQAITLDCFAWHVKPDLSKVDVVKIDVEGFEIAVLRGAKNSLLHPDVKIGSLLIEVGPDRWERGGVSLDAGMNEMKELAGRFKYAYVIIRERGAYWQTCAPALASKILSNKGGAPVKIKDVNNNAILHWVAMDEWVPLLTEMNVTGSDCNFWFKN